MHRQQLRTRQTPRFQWVPKSSSSAAAPKPPSQTLPSAAPPPNGRGKRRHRRSRPARKARCKGEARNWADMPSDALSVIFEKLGAIRVLLEAQAVCRSWRHLAHEPGSWRKIDFRIDVWDYYGQGDRLLKMAHTAVDRSKGLVEEFSVEHFADDELLLYMAERNPGLKCLRLISCYEVSEYGISDAMKKLPLLEEMDVAFYSFCTEDAIPSIGRSCPRLKSFHLNAKGCKKDELLGYEDHHARAIAESMPMLRELQLFGNELTNEGLKEILDGCPHLKSLDIRQCFNVKMDEDLKKRCAKISTLRLPNDSVADYPFDSDYADLRTGFDPDLDYYDDFDCYDYDPYNVDSYEDYASFSYEDPFLESDGFRDFLPDLAEMHGIPIENFYCSD